MPLPRMPRPAALLVCAAAVALAAACPQPGKRPAARRTPPPDSAGQVMFGVRAPLTHLGESKGIVVADSGFVYDDGMSIDLHRVTVTFIDSEGADVAVLTAREASYSLADSRLNLLGSVEIVGRDGRKLTTASMQFDIARDRLIGDTAYVLTGASARERPSLGFVADPALRRVLSREAQRKLDEDSAKAAAGAAAKAAALAAKSRAAKAPTAKPGAAPPVAAVPPATRPTAETARPPAH